METKCSETLRKRFEKYYFTYVRVLNFLSNILIFVAFGILMYFLGKS